MNTFYCELDCVIKCTNDFITFIASDPAAGDTPDGLADQVKIDKNVEPSNKLLTPGNCD